MHIQQASGGSSVPPGGFILAKSTASLDGFLRVDGSLIDGDIYPNLVPICPSSVPEISGGQQVLLADILEITASGSLSSYYAPSKAFDGLTDWASSAGWAVGSSSAYPWIKVRLGASKTVSAFRVFGGYTTSLCQLYGSNDGVGWVLLADYSADATSVASGASRAYAVANPGSYLYYKLQRNTAWGDFGLAELQLFEGASIKTKYKLPTKADISGVSVGYDWFVKY